MIVPVIAISNLVLTRQIYCEETKGAHAHNRDRVPLNTQADSIRAMVAEMCQYSMSRIYVC